MELHVYTITWLEKTLVHQNVNESEKLSWAQSIVAKCTKFLETNYKQEGLSQFPAGVVLQTVQFHANLVSNELQVVGFSER